MPGSDLEPCFSWDAVITGTHWRHGEVALAGERVGQAPAAAVLLGSSIGNLPMLRTKQWLRYC